MSGYSAELFLEDVDQEFLCSIWWVNVIPAFFSAIYEFWLLLRVEDTADVQQ